MYKYLQSFYNECPLNLVQEQCILQETRIILINIHIQYQNKNPDFNAIFPKHIDHLKSIDEK